MGHVRSPPSNLSRNRCSLYLSTLLSPRCASSCCSSTRMDIELLRLRRRHHASRFLCITPHRHSTSNLFWLTLASPRRSTLLSSSAPLFADHGPTFLSGHNDSAPHRSQYSCSFRHSSTLRDSSVLPRPIDGLVNVLAVHPKSFLYIDGVKVARVAYLLTARADLKLVAKSDSHSVGIRRPIQHLYRYISTLSLSLSMTPLHRSVQPPVFPRVIRHAFASWLGLQSLIRSRTGLPPLKPLQASEGQVIML